MTSKNSRDTLGRTAAIALGAIPIAFGVLAGFFILRGIGMDLFPTNETGKVAEATQAYPTPEIKRYLCRAASACRNYDRVRLECATAGHFKTCLRIKMGNEAQYADLCSGFKEGAPAEPRPKETPNFVQCFFLNLFHDESVP
jgi:hypothetical protein